MAVVILDNIYVAANYKERQLGKIKPGQKVKIKVDTDLEKFSTGKSTVLWQGRALFFLSFPLKMLQDTFQSGTEGTGKDSI